MGDENYVGEEGLATEIGCQHAVINCDLGDSPNLARLHCYNLCTGEARGTTYDEPPLEDGAEIG